MSKDTKEKKKEKKKAKKKLLADIQVPENCKTKCCKDFKKGEDKRCKRCPLFDLIKLKKVA
ncbi:MAG: hypothetical protein V4548_06605 [Bacteroidota bacterium]